MSYKSFPCITLTSDYGLKDYYLPATKGAFINQFDKDEYFNLVDISHNIEPFHLAQAAYIISGAFSNFPEGTVHCLGMHVGNKRHIAALYRGHYFLAEDNGILSLIFQSKPDAVVEINRIKADNTHSNFSFKDLYPKAACHLARGGAMELLGTRIDEEYDQKLPLKPTVSADGIVGQVIYVDRIGNVITNITQKLFNDNLKGRKFRIKYSIEINQIAKIHSNYFEVPIGEKIALFNDMGHLEIAINLGSNATSGGANQLFGLQLGTTIRVEYYVD
jgi:S-adenosylmethionine hydrolase